MTLAITPLATGFHTIPWGTQSHLRTTVTITPLVTGFYRPVNHTGSPQDDGSNNSVSNWICIVLSPTQGHPRTTVAITPWVTGLYRPVSPTGSPQDDGSNNSVSNWIFIVLSPTQGHPRTTVAITPLVTGFYRPVNHTGSPQDDGSNNSVSFGFRSTNNFVRGPDKTVTFLWPRFLLSECYIYIYICVCMWVLLYIVGPWGLARSPFPVVGVICTCPNTSWKLHWYSAGTPNARVRIINMKTASLCRRSTRSPQTTVAESLPFL